MPDIGLWRCEVSGCGVEIAGESVVDESHGPRIEEHKHSHHERTFVDGCALCRGELLARLRDAHDGDTPHESGDDRYAIYSIRPGRVGPEWDEPHGESRRIAETSLAGIGMTLAVLRGEQQLTNDSRVGILDRLTRTWIVNPWAKGDA